MASSLITGAVSIMLILISGYIIANGILTISETMINTQSDISAMDEQILQSDIQIIAYQVTTDLVLEVKNTGNTIYSVSDLNKFDLYLCTSGVISKVTPKSKTINNDLVNKNMWDPGEVLLVTYDYSTSPSWAKVVTSNGISASTNV